MKARLNPCQAAPDAAFEEVRRHFREPELVKLALAKIDAWNLIAIGGSAYTTGPARAT